MDIKNIYFMRFLNNMKSIYVGNLPYNKSENDIRDLFATYGNVESVKIISDMYTGQSKGFGFVEMDENDANNAIQGLNGSNFGGRDIKVNEAKERRQSRPRY
jgi:RNA recognition motif-containing protein